MLAELRGVLSLSGSRAHGPAPPGASSLSRSGSSAPFPNGVAQLYAGRASREDTARSTHQLATKRGAESQRPEGRGRCLLLRRSRVPGLPGHSPQQRAATPLPTRRASESSSLCILGLSGPLHAMESSERARARGSSPRRASWANDHWKSCSEFLDFFF